MVIPRSSSVTVKLARRLADHSVSPPFLSLFLLKSVSIRFRSTNSLGIDDDPNSKLGSSRSSAASSINHSHSFSSLINGGGEQIQDAAAEAVDGNPDEMRRKIAQDAGEICKLLSENPNSPINALLDKASVEISPALALDVLQKLSNAGLLALAFFRWAEKQKGVNYSTESYNALIEALGKIKQFRLIWNLVREMKGKGILSKETFHLISRRYARARKVREAVEAVERMENFNMTLEVSDFNRLIDTLSKSRKAVSAQQVFDEMKKRKFKPDIKSYSILLEGWSQEKNLLKLKEVYAEMTDEGFKPDVITYGIMINAHCKAKKYEEAIDLFREMEAKNIKPSPHIFCTLINGLGSEKRLNEALEFFELSKANGFRPEAPTYNAVIGAHCWSTRFDDAFRTVDEMRKYKIGPNSRTFDIILYHLIKGWRTKEAYSVYKGMSNDRGCKPTVSTYEIMVRMFCKEERVDMALRVWDDMRKRGVIPVMHMFSTLIPSLCHENKLDEACKYFEEMVDIGIRPPAQMFSNLKQSLLDQGRKEIASDLSKKIDKLRKAPFIG